MRRALPKLLSTARSLLRGLARDTRAGVAVTYALLAVPMTTALGLALDVGMAYHVRTRLEHALDATALAVGGSIGNRAQLLDRGQRFFDANFPAEKFGQARNFTLSITDDVISVSGEATSETFFLKLANVNTIDVSAAAEVTRSIRGLEVALVLDNTGSMNSNNNIGALRDAARELTHILFGDRTSHDKLYMAVVPYSASVNPGYEAENLVSGAATVSPNPTNGWRGCVIERPAPHTFADTSAASHPWTPYVWPPAVDNDYDPNRPNTIRFGAGYGNGGTGPNLGCPTPIRPLINIRGQVISAISQMKAWSRGGTFSDIGMAWGLRVLSPEPPFTEGKPWDTPKWNKAVVLMTDGNNQFYKLPYNAGPNQANGDVQSDFSGYGRLDEFGILGTTNIHTAKSVINDNLARVCEDIKAKGIMVYTVTFTNSLNAATKDIYRNCASDVTKYFDSPTQADLRDSFKAIATELSKLRLSR